MEPAAYHGNGLDFYRELIHSFCLSIIIDLTPLDDRCGLAAMASGVKQYVALCFTDCHAERLQERLIDMTFNSLTNPKMSGLYDPMAVADMTSSVGDDGNDGEPPEPSGKPRAKAKGKAETHAKAKAKDKAKAKAKDNKDGASVAQTALQDILKGLEEDPAAEKTPEELPDSA